MVDISKCSGLNCPVKEQCHRFVAVGHPTNQSFIMPPFTITNNKFSCSLFWGSQNDGIIKQLENIMKPKQPK